ncbi:MAG: glycosyltransferase family 39 protein [Anaerolineales bacterium]|nr:glycosyltransferase family 39 protein [Anaerolineales bacterium]
MSRIDRIAVFLSLLAVLAGYFVATRIFEQMAHLEDEMAYVWQAQAIAKGHLTLPSPPYPKSFLTPFVVDYNGQRFGKYPPGWPAMLALGVIFNARALVNPLLAGLCVWLTYRLGKRLFSPVVGLLAAVFTLTSPFFLINSGSLLSHPFGLFLCLVFVLGWLDSWYPEDSGSTLPSWRGWLPLAASAIALGLLILTRPLTAMGVSFPIIFHGSYIFIRGDRKTRWRLSIFCLVVLTLAGLLFVWQAAVTGDPLLNPYTLWWEYDKVGFGEGFGRAEGGHSLRQARINTKFSLKVGYSDLFGWFRASWIFLPFGMLALLFKRHWKALMVAFIFPSLVLMYVFYWIGSNLYGPRYYFEGLPSLTILSAAGIAWLAGWQLQCGDDRKPNNTWSRLRLFTTLSVVAFLVSANVFFYLPQRLTSMCGLYGVNRERLKPFLTEQVQQLTPALVIVYPDKWTEYGALLELQDPFLDSPVIFVMNRGEKENAAVARAFPERKAYLYFPKQPYKLVEFEP